MIVRGKSRHELCVGLWLSIGITLVVLFFYRIDGFEWLERRTYDMRVQLKGEHDLQTSIVMVENDEATIEHLGMSPSKVSRIHYAQAIEHLRASGAALIAFDMVFSGRTVPAEDAALSQAIQQAGNVVLARYIGAGDHVSPFETFRKYELGEGLINLSLDTDGVLRSIPFLGVSYANTQLTPFITFGAEVARLSIDPIGQFPLDVTIPDVATFGPIEIPYPQGKMFINFYGPPGTFPSLPLWRVVKGKFDADDVKGKVILVGGTAVTLHDYYQTPFGKGTVKTLSQSHAESEGRLMAGLEVHANVVQTILDKSFVHRSSSSTVQWSLAMLGVCCWIFIMVYPTNATQVSVFSLLLLVLVVVVSVALFNVRHFWLDVAPFVSLVNAHYGIGMAYQRYLMSRQKEQLRSMFSQYMSPVIVEHLWNRRETLLHGDGPRSQDLTVTTLAVGLDGVSIAMDHLGQKQILEWTNDYFEEIEQTIMHYRGVVEDYAQDGLLVHFGIPVPRESEREIRQDAQNAVQCAFAIHAVLAKIHAKWKGDKLPPLDMYAGICTGCALITTVGSRGRLKFTTLGTPVRMALCLKRVAFDLSRDQSTPKIICGVETIPYVDQSCLIKPLNEIHDDIDNQSFLPYQVLAVEPVRVP
ncbi:MAG: adenylate/guanylate cyclase domain-containing protein [Nitrospirales bacterium]|nr:MAG: adenylate/guanylate cyclase domain-containing protein [Nitrospirales bacterium]